MFCPLCGQPLFVGSSHNVVSRQVQGLTDGRPSCFCFFSDEDLGKMRMEEEDGLSERIRDRFPSAKNLDEVRMQVDALPRDSSDRAEFVVRLRFLERLKEEIARRSINGEEIRKIEAARTEEAKEIAVGKVQSFNSWLRGF